MQADAIVTGEQPKLQTLDSDHDDNNDDLKGMEAKTASIIRLWCSPEVQCIVKNIRNHHEMWNT